MLFHQNQYTYLPETQIVMGSKMSAESEEKSNSKDFLNLQRDHRISKSAPLLRKKTLINVRKISRNLTKNTSGEQISLVDTNFIAEVWYQFIFPQKLFFADALRRAVSRSCRLAAALKLPKSDSAIDLYLLELGTKIRHHFVQTIDALTRRGLSGAYNVEVMGNLNRRLGSKYGFLIPEEFEVRSIICHSQKSAVKSGTQ